MDITDLFTSESSSTTSQTSFTEAEMQTIDLNSDAGVQTINQSVQTSLELINKGVQTKPDLQNIMLSHHGSIVENGIVPSTVDFSLIEAYVPFPEMLNTTN
jgi:hypothetical protein